MKEMLKEVSSIGNVWEQIACLSAFFLGLFVFKYWCVAQERKRQKQKVRQAFLDFHERSVLTKETATKGISKEIILLMQSQSSALALKPQQNFLSGKVWLIGVHNLDDLVKKAGVKSRIDEKGFCRVHALFTLGGMLVCALLGAVFSNELMLVGVLLGAFIGWKLPIWALKQEVKARGNDLENHLSEMLEVVSLGLRSGLSFDRSFELYHLHFDTALARESASTQRQWQMGLSFREDALRGLACTYESALFSRVIENIIRSLRFGTSLADSFDACAFEARALHKSYREEEVAKAPVKMLVPTAALILPAMLLLVLGPVLLEMIHGF